MPRKNTFSISRRQLLIGGSLGGAALLLGVYFKTGGELVKGPLEVWDNTPGAFAPNAWLRIDQDGSVTVRVNHSEMGQGVTTALPMLIAEELDMDWTTLHVEIAPAEAVYKNPAFHAQFTGDSTSVRTSWDILRRAGAVARAMLIGAAAQTWKVPTSECRTENSVVMHDATGRQLGYGELAPIAATLPIPEAVPLKAPKDFKVIGQRYRRLDTPLKTTGKAVFGIDVQMPGLLIATVVHPPIIGGMVKTLDSSRATALPGVHSVLKIDTGIAVVADTFWQAKRAADALSIEWRSAGRDPISSTALRAQWAERASREQGDPVYQHGEVEPSMAGASQTIRAVYELPYQAHATPEPMNCTAYVHDGHCEVWAPTQNQDAAQEVAAKITGLAYKDIDIHTTYLGGGFGRRINVDYVAEAVQISKAMGKPVKMIWTREEDIQHDFFRPAAYNVVEVGLDAQGLPVAWTHKIVGSDFMTQGLPVIFPSILPYQVPRGIRNLASSLLKAVAPTVIPGKKAGEGASPFPYHIANIQVSYINAEPGIPIGFWRSVAFSMNTFVVESVMDEIATATGQDPFDLRARLLANTPRLRNVMRLAAEKANWRQKPVDGVFRGIAVVNFQETMIGMVAEVSVTDTGAVKVHRIVCAIDCGVVINPNIVTAQMEGGIAFGLTATLKSHITIEKSRVEQSNFHNFPLLCMDEMPQVEVHIVPSDRPPTGVGESAVPTVAPAVTNAVFAATGKRIRKIPIDPNELRFLD